MVDFKDISDRQTARKENADIFQQIDQLFKGQQPVGTVSVYSLHRFLASDQNFAPFAKQFSSIRDDSMVVEIWRTSLPRIRTPWLKWPAPKKPPAVDALVKKYADVENLSIVEAESQIQTITQMGKLGEALQYYGIEPPKEKKAK
jgi:hypothetical protein